MLKGEIDFALVKVRIISSETSFTLQVHTNQSHSLPFKFRPDSNTNLSFWLTSLKFLVDLAPPKPQNPPIILPLKFWKPNYISQTHQLLTNAETGDLVLFAGRDFGSALIRSLTGSSFDHVGVLVRLSDNHVVLFESLAGRGVCKWRWDFL